MNKHKILALSVTVLFLVLIFYKIDWLKLLETFKTFNFKYLWIIAPLYYLTLYLRGIRWKALLMDDKKYSSYHLGAVFTVGSMLNIFLPARAGDIYRAYYLGENKNESKMKIFGSIILERTEDGQLKVHYGEKESEPMYISYKGFLTEEEACEEHKTMMDHKEEYVNAKTVDQYMQEY